MRKVYKYKAYDLKNRPVTGEIEAEDRSEAIMKLKPRYPEIESIENIGEKGKGLSMKIFEKKIRAEEIGLLCSQYALMAEAGIKTLDSTRILKNQVENKRLKEMLTGVEGEVENGVSLSDAFENQGKSEIPVTFYETIRAGEYSGNPGMAFRNLADYFERVSESGKKVKSALIYPVFVVAVAIVVLIVVMAYVVPNLTATFESMHAELPGITKVLLGVSGFFERNMGLLLGGVIALVALGAGIRSTERGKRQLDRLKLKLPCFGKIIMAEQAGQFAETFSMLLQSGIPMVQALKITGNTLKNKVFQESVYRVCEGVKEGESPSISLENQNCFPKPLISMARIGEETGNMEKTFQGIGKYYRNEANLLVKSLLTKLEPALLAGISVFAGLIVISIYLPLFQMYEIF